MHVIGWQDVAIRLCLTVIAGLLIGLNRSERGRPAGMRTTLLVCIAASLAMVQANLLLISVGKSSNSFVSMDIMRLPLGILTGVGFIGAGAIFRRNDFVLGVTTAATLWFVTVIGLCFGGGQIWLGVAGTGIGLAVLWGLRVVELRIPRERVAILTVKTATHGPTSEQVRGRLEQSDLRVTKLRESYLNAGEATRTMRFQLLWHGLQEDPDVPAVIAELARWTGVNEVDWYP